MSDNFHLEIRAESKDHFAATMRMIFDKTPGNKASHFIIHESPERESLHGSCPTKAGMYFSFLWTSDPHPNTKPLPYQMSVELCIDLAWEWLKGQDYPFPPDHDGDNQKGYILTTGDLWGHFPNIGYAHICSICPDWQMYGK